MKRCWSHQTRPKSFCSLTEPQNLAPNVFPRLNIQSLIHGLLPIIQKKINESLLTAVNDKFPNSKHGKRLFDSRKVAMNVFQKALVCYKQLCQSFVRKCKEEDRKKTTDFTNLVFKTTPLKQESYTGTNQSSERVTLVQIVNCIWPTLWVWPNFPRNSVDKFNFHLNLSKPILSSPQFQLRLIFECLGLWTSILWLFFHHK